MSQNLKIIVILIVASAIIGAIAGGITTFLLQTPQGQTVEDLIKDFYFTEAAVHVSPHHIRKAMDKGDKSFILVDLRSQQEYEGEHIIGAINIPAYKDPNTSDYGDVERIVSEFAELPKDKDIIVYCYSTPCMTGRKVGKMLAENGIYVKQLGVGWNEWRHFWTLWNHEHEWGQTTVEDYVSTGTEPGIPQTRELPSPCGEGEFSC